MHGHYEIKPTRDDAFSDDAEKINMGIGIVMPIRQAREVVDQPFFAEAEDAEIQRELSKSD
jgi:hypothetical protein